MRRTTRAAPRCPPPAAQGRQPRGGATSTQLARAWRCYRCGATWGCYGRSLRRRAPTLFLPRCGTVRSGRNSTTCKRWWWARTRRSPRFARISAATIVLTRPWEIPTASRRCWRRRWRRCASRSSRSSRRSTSNSSASLSGTRRNARRCVRSSRRRPRGSSAASTPSRCGTTTSRAPRACCDFTRSPCKVVGQARLGREAWDEPASGRRQAQWRG
mmetsp:Transcript_60613/g.138541  ORF Transcript_60613/g.138541 Transcript_60613/m.138541 type:complete len:215 (-) Transcript_60613:75-719(-)